MSQIRWLRPHSMTISRFQKCGMRQLFFETTTATSYVKKRRWFSQTQLIFQFVLEVLFSNESLDVAGLPLLLTHLGLCSSFVFPTKNYEILNLVSNESLAYLKYSESQTLIFLIIRFLNTLHCRIQNKSS